MSVFSISFCNRDGCQGIPSSLNRKSAPPVTPLVDLLITLGQAAFRVANHPSQARRPATGLSAIKARTLTLRLRTFRRLAPCRTSFRPNRASATGSISRFRSSIAGDRVPRRIEVLKTYFRATPRLCSAGESEMHPKLSWLIYAAILIPSAAVVNVVVKEVLKERGQRSPTLPLLIPSESN